MTITAARYTTAEEVQIAVTDDGNQVLMPSFPSNTYYDVKMQAYIDDGGVIDRFPVPLPAPDNEAGMPALSVAKQGEVIWNQDDRRRSVGATPIIHDESITLWDDWMKTVYEAQDAGVQPPEPPVFVRQAISMDGDLSGKCVIRWKEFTGTWAGWGFEAEFERADITSLGLKVYDENGGYLYALTFQSVPGSHNRWVTETPAGFATPTKIARLFEIIAGSAPVTKLETLDETKEYISLIVKWQPSSEIFEEDFIESNEQLT